MIRSVVVASLILFFVGTTRHASALIPPMSKKSLQSRASLIAIGTVVRVAPRGKAYKDHCYHWQRYIATFRVLSRSKGKSAPTISIVFATRGGHVNPKRPCTGGRSSYHLSRGTKYQLHLSGLGKGKNLVYSFINWAGVKRLR